MAGKRKHIVLPYAPRAAFMPFHERKKRWAVLVAHRRAGKTVAVVNELIKAAIGKRNGKYAYIAPFRSQAKTVAWEYFKYYAKPLIREVNEAELLVTLINGAAIQLFGADNADAMRGLGFDGVAMDEYGDFRPSVWGNVIRPTLSDRQGWAVFMGTPKGHNQFYERYRKALEDVESYFCLVLKASESGLLHPEELRDARSQSSEDQYNQEYECSFDAAIQGAFYGKEMTAVDAEKRIGVVEFQPGFPVHTAWDIGRTDDTAIWWYQKIGNEIHVLDFFAEAGGSIEDYREGQFWPGSLVREIRDRAVLRGYQYGTHWLPHDARAKTLASDGKSVVEKLAKYLGFSTLAIAPNLAVEDGIQAVRTLLPRCWFDTSCNVGLTGGLEALRQYQREYDEDKKVFKKIPLHNWASHPADAFRYLAVSEQKFVEAKPVYAAPGVAPRVYPSTYGVTLDQLWERHEEKLLEEVRL